MQKSLALFLAFALLFLAPTEGALFTLDLSTVAGGICTVSLGGAGCTLQALLSALSLGSIGNTDEVAVTASSAGSYAVNFASQIYPTSFSVSSSASATVNVIIQSGGILSTGNLTLSSNTNLQVQGIVNVTGVLTMASGAAAWVQSSAICRVQGVANIAGNIYASATGSVGFVSATVYLSAQASINDSVTLLGNTVVQAQSGVAYVGGAAVQSVNNTILAAQGARVQITAWIRVQEGAALTLAGNVYSNATAIVNGTLTTATTTATDTAANVQFTAGLAVATGATLAVSASTSVYVNALATLDGTTTLAANTALWLGAAACRIRHLASQGVNTTVQAAQGTTVTVYGNVSVAANGALYLTGGVVWFASGSALNVLNGAAYVASQTIIDAQASVKVAASSALNIVGQVTSNTSVSLQDSSSLVVGGSSGSSSSSSASFSSGISSSSGTSVQVNSGCTLIITQDTTLSGSVTLSAGSFFIIQSGATNVTNSIVANGNTTVNSVLRFTGSTATYTQQQGNLILNAGIVIVSSVSIGASASTSASLCGNGVISGNLQVNAGLSIGNSPGTISVSGDCSFASTATFSLELASLTLFDKLNCGGNVHHNGALKVIVLGAFSAAGNSFTFINYNGTGDGTFSLSQSADYSVTYGSKSTTCVAKSSSSTTSGAEHLLPSLFSFFALLAIFVTRKF